MPNHFRVKDEETIRRLLIKIFYTRVDRLVERIIESRGRAAFLGFLPGKSGDGSESRTFDYTSEDNWSDGRRKATRLSRG